MSTQEERLSFLEAEVQSLREQVEQLRNDLVMQLVLTSSGTVTNRGLFGSLRCSTIKCSAIHIVDREGRERIEMSADEGSAVGIRVWDAEGNLRITIQSLDDGAAGILLWDQEGKIRVIMDTDPEGNPSLDVEPDLDEDEDD
jgi:hypothetical protein